MCLRSPKIYLIIIATNTDMKQHINSIKTYCMMMWLHMSEYSTCSRLTRMDVIEAAWACRTVMGAQVRRHHTRMVLSQLAEARSVFSWLTAMSQISAEWPRSVASKRPSSVAQILTRQSSEP